MKMSIEKAFTFTFDTDLERKRINEGFNNNKTAQKKLHKLMDLVEQGAWGAAYAELESKWWCGRDREYECPRIEFVGMLDAVGSDDAWITYADLIWRMVNLPNVYKVKTTEEVV